MSSMARTFPIDSIASEARPSTEAERLAMLELVGRLDDAKPTQDYPALVGAFHTAEKYDWVVFRGLAQAFDIDIGQRMVRPTLQEGDQIDLGERRRSDPFLEAAFSPTLTGCSENRSRDPSNSHLRFT